MFAGVPDGAEVVAPLGICQAPQQGDLVEAQQEHARVALQEVGVVVGMAAQEQRVVSMVLQQSAFGGVLHPDLAGYWETWLASTVLGGYFLPAIGAAACWRLGFVYSPRSMIEHTAAGAYVLIIATTVSDDLAVTARTVRGTRLKELPIALTDESGD